MQSDLVGSGFLKALIVLDIRSNWQPEKNGPHLNGFHVFPRGNIRKTFTVMHYPVFEHLDTLSIAFLVSIILYIDGKQFKCSVFTFVQYISLIQSIIVVAYLVSSSINCSYS